MKKETLVFITKNNETITLPIDTNSPYGQGFTTHQSDGLIALILATEANSLTYKCKMKVVEGGSFLQITKSDFIMVSDKPVDDWVQVGGVYWKPNSEGLKIDRTQALRHLKNYDRIYKCFPDEKVEEPSAVYNIEVSLDKAEKLCAERYEELTQNTNENINALVFKEVLMLIRNAQNKIKEL